MAEPTDEFDEIVTSAGQPEALSMAIDIHVDMMAFISAGFTRYEAFEIVRDRESSRVSYLYAKDLMEHGEGHNE